MNKLFKKFKAGDKAEAAVGMVGVIVGILITLMVVVLVFYNIVGSIDTSSIDSEIGEATTTPSDNATSNVLTQAETVFTIMPIVCIVIVAVVILTYVSKIGGS